MSQHPDVLIVGGGIIGLTAAYYLAREGMRIGIVDQSDLGREASWAGAGILPPGDATAARSDVERLRAHSTAVLPALSAELREATGIDNGYVRCGGLAFGADSDPATLDEWRGEGVRAELVRGEALWRLEPALARDVGTAYFLPEMAQLRNPRHLQALIAGCRQRGVGLQPGCPVMGFERAGSRIAAAQTGLGRVVAGQFLIAAGAWSEALLTHLGCAPGVRPVRGQIVLLNSGAPVLRHVLLSGTRYLVPRVDGRVLVGSTEEEVGFDRRTTASAIGDLLGLACRLVPPLAAAPVERCWAGLRPGSPDGLPFLGPVPGFDNLLVAAGHYRAGIQLSAGTALLVKEYLLGQPLTVPLDAFRLDRAADPAFRA